MITSTGWIRAHRGKIERTLCRKLLEMYRPYKWLPCFLHKALYFLRATIIKHDVIVQFGEGFESFPAVTAEDQEHVLKVINAAALKISARKMTDLLASGSVEKIWEDRKVSAILDVAAPSVHAREVWNLPYTGENVGIAVVDTGVYRHPDLTKPENRLIAFKDFVRNKVLAYDDNGHGTHCAGAAAGNGTASRGKYRGIAYEANIIGVKVLDKQGSGNISTVIKGIQWCIENKDKYNIRIISLSLGAPAERDSASDPLCLAVSKAWEAGIVVCAATGNEGPEAKTICTPGIDPDVITVGAIDDIYTVDRADDAVADFSSRGPTISGDIKPDIVAPGVDIISLRSPNSFLDKTARDHRVDSWYFSLSGTSMATPICAGAVALLLEANPLLSPAQVKKLLADGGENMGYPQTIQGAGYIHLEKMMKKLFLEKQ